jgi:hypothetical protein
MSATLSFAMSPVVSVGTTVEGIDDSPVVRLADSSGADVVWSSCLYGGEDSTADGVERDEIGANEIEAEIRDEINNADEREMANETAHINDDRTAIPPTDADAVIGDIRRRRNPATAPLATALDISSAANRPAGSTLATGLGIVTTPTSPAVR